MLVLRITEVRGYTVEQNKPDGEKEPERAEPRPDAGRMGRPHQVEMRSGRDPAPQKEKPLCRLLLQSTQHSGISHSESLSIPSTSYGSILSMGVAKCRVAPAG